MMKRFIIAALPLLALALSAGAEASLRTGGLAGMVSGAAGSIQLAQHEETYGDENYYGDEGQTNDADDYGDALPEDKPAEDEYADEEQNEEGLTDEQAAGEEEYDVATDENYYDKDPHSLVQPGDTFDPFLPPPNQ
jgi:hypothetical protein